MWSHESSPAPRLVFHLRDERVQNRGTYWQNGRYTWHRIIRRSHCTVTENGRECGDFGSWWTSSEPASPAARRQSHDADAILASLHVVGRAGGWRGRAALTTAVGCCFPAATASLPPQPSLAVFPLSLSLPPSFPGCCLSLCCFCLSCCFYFSNHCSSNLRFYSNYSHQLQECSWWRYCRCQIALNHRNLASNYTENMAVCPILSPRQRSYLASNSNASFVSSIKWDPLQGSGCVPGTSWNWKGGIHMSTSHDLKPVNVGGIWIWTTYYIQVCMKYRVLSPLCLC